LAGGARADGGDGGDDPTLAAFLARLRARLPSGGAVRPSPLKRREDEGG
jgi:hypothetical protein